MKAQRFNTYFTIYLGLQLSLALQSHAQDGFPDPRPLGNSIQAHGLDSVEQQGELTFEAALALALQNNPGLAASAREVHASDADASQEGMLPNPEFEFEAEGFAGSGGLSGTDAMETTIAINQTFELGGKRNKRHQVALARRDLAGWDYETERLDLITKVRKRFVEVAVMQEESELAKHRVELAQKAYDTVVQLVQAGKVPPIDEKNALVELTNSKIEQRRSSSQLKIARNHLAILWGQKNAQFTQVTANLRELQPLPVLDELQPLLERAPEISRWDSKLLETDNALKLQKAQAIPDISAGLGVRHENESDDTALVAAISIPLPLFNRNQGAVRAAETRKQKAEILQTDAIASGENSLRAAYQELSLLEEEVKLLDDIVLPAAQESFRVAQEGYRQGKMAYLDVLHAQRTLFETESQFISTLRDYHQAIAGLERIIGGPWPKSE